MTHVRYMCVRTTPETTILSTATITEITVSVLLLLLLLLLLLPSNNERCNFANCEIILTDGHATAAADTVGGCRMDGCLDVS